MNIYDTLRGLLDILGAVFLRLVNVSIAAGVMILAMALIRKVFPKMPKWLCCLLWVLPALRLLLPFSLPNPYSLAPNIDTVYEMRTAVADMGGVSVPVLNSGIEAVDNAVNPALERTFVAATESAAAVTSKVRDFDPSAFFGLIWAAGCAVMLAYLLISFLRFRRKVRPCVPYEKGVYLTDGVSAPFILGLLWPRIYLPSALPEAHYPAILAHERAHLKRKDHWWKPLGFLLLAVHWFNPLVWLGYRLLCRDIEFACDEKVIRDADPAAKKAYSEALLTCGAPLKGTSACPLAFGEVGVKARIKRVLHYKKPAVWIAAVALLAASVSAFCFLTDRPSMWVNQWGSVYVSDKVYLDPVLSPGKASKQTPFRLILDDENHMLLRHVITDIDNGENRELVRDLGQADIGGEYLGGADLWALARDYAPAQYRHSEPQKSPGVAVRRGANEDYSYYVLFRPRGNVFFYAVFNHYPGQEPVLESLRRMKRVGPFKQETGIPRWYVTVPVRDVRYINVSGDFGNYITYCGHRNKEQDALCFDVGEKVFLCGLDGVEDISRLSVAAYKSDHTPIDSFLVPNGTSADYTDEKGWRLTDAEADILDGGASASAVITAFLRTWFTPDIKDRYTRLHQNWPSGSQAADEQAIADYFSDVRDYMTDEFYQKTVMNRGYHSYDQFAAERGLSVTVRGVRIETADDGNYTFTVHLKNGNRGLGDYASGNLRMKGGKIDGMHVSVMTLGQDLPESGETPTSYDYGAGETARYEEEWSTMSVEQTAVDADLMDSLHITPSLLPLAEQALQPVNRSVESGGVRVTVTQALHYPTVVGAVVTVDFDKDLLGSHRAGDLWYPAFTLTSSCENSYGNTAGCVVIRQENERVTYFFRLFCGEEYFTSGTELLLTLKGFSEVQGDFALSLSQPLAVSWQATYVSETVRTLTFSSEGGFSGTAMLTPLSLLIKVSQPFPDNSWIDDVLLRDADNRPITGLSCQTAVGPADTDYCNLGLTAFLDPDAVGWLRIDERELRLN